MATQRNEMLPRIRVKNGEYINHITALEGGNSDQTNQVHMNKLRVVVEGHAFAVVDEMVNSVRGLTATGVGGGSAEGIIIDVFTGDAAV